MMRKRYDASFKAKIALEVVKSLKTVNEIATEAGVHPTVITKWKRQLLEGLPQIFANNHKHKDGETEKLPANLYQKIGQLEVELDWLKKKSLLPGNREKRTY
jgi:putative transposase